MTDVSSASHGEIVVLSIDRPSRANALRHETIAELRQALEQSEAEAVLAVVITGSHGRFSAGADLDCLSGSTEDLRFDDELEALTTAIVMSPMVVIAAVEGSCFGAAVDLAWSCDAVVVGRDTRIALPATRLGILYNPRSLKRLHARLGAALLGRLVVVAEELSGADVGSVGAALAVEQAAVQSTAIGLAQQAGVTSATEATKALLASFDMAEFDADSWQQRREELLASPSRAMALRNRKSDLRGKRQK